MIHAVAGSGKTTYIINSLNLQKRTAIITYTIKNQELLREAIVDKFGYFPDNLHLFGAVEFLYSFCLIPNMTEKFKGIIFDAKIISQHHRKFPNSFSAGQYIFHNMISNYIIKYKLDYKKRISKYFDKIYIDEFQDFESYDFELIMSLSDLNIRVVLVGDYYQKTFSISRKGNKGVGINKNFDTYKNEIIKNNFKFDDSSFKGSYRCPKNICDFVSEKLNIQIESINNNKGNVTFVDDIIKIEQIMKNDSIVKLFYQQHYKFDCESANWGECKGQTYKKVCVVLNPNTAKLYLKDNLISLAETTKAKFYVACTRTESDLYFILQNNIPKKFIIK